MVNDTHFHVYVRTFQNRGFFSARTGSPVTKSETNDFIPPKKALANNVLTGVLKVIPNVQIERVDIKVQTNGAVLL